VGFITHRFHFLQRKDQSQFKHVTRGSKSRVQRRFVVLATIPCFAPNGALRGLYGFSEGGQFRVNYDMFCDFVSFLKNRPHFPANKPPALGKAFGVFAVFRIIVHNL